MDNNGELLAQIGATIRLPDVTFVEEPGAVAPIVAAAVPVPVVDPWTKPDPVDLCLKLWKRCMAGDSIAKATDAVIDSMARLHVCGRSTALAA